MKIIIINHSYPEKGETFLDNELKYSNEKDEIILAPIFLSKKYNSTNKNKNVISGLSEKKVFDIIRAVLLGLFDIFAANELSAIYLKRNSLRNFLKAWKMAAVSEFKAKKIAKYLLKNYSDESFVLYSYWMYETAFIALKLKKIFPKSFVITRCHGYDLYEERHENFYIPFRKYIFSNMHKIFCISENGKQYIKNTYGNNWSDKIEVMRLGTSYYGINNPLKERKIVLASCSNLVDVKRVNLIIKALMESTAQIKWIHIGDGILRSELEELSKKLPKNVECKFLGLMKNEEVMKFYKNQHIDVFINVSESEGVPVSIMEALSFGIPIVATDVGGTHEIVIDKYNGILLNKNFKSGELLDSISFIVDDNKYRRNAIKVWNKMCSAKVNYKEFYEKLLQKGSY